MSTENKLLSPTENVNQIIKNNIKREYGITLPKGMTITEEAIQFLADFTQDFIYDLVNETFIKAKVDKCCFGTSDKTLNDFWFKEILNKGEYYDITPELLRPILLAGFPIMKMQFKDQETKLALEKNGNFTIKSPPKIIDLPQIEHEFFNDTMSDMSTPSSIPYNQLNGKTVNCDSTHTNIAFSTDLTTSTPKKDEKKEFELLMSKLNKQLFNNNDFTKSIGNDLVNSISSNNNTLPSKLKESLIKNVDYGSVYQGSRLSQSGPMYVAETIDNAKTIQKELVNKLVKPSIIKWAATDETSFLPQSDHLKNTNEEEIKQLVPQWKNNSIPIFTLDEFNNCLN